MTNSLITDMQKNQVVAVQPIVLQARKDELQHYVQAGSKVMAHYCARQSGNSRLSEEGKAVQVVVWTLFDDPEHVRAALAAGAQTDVLKQDPAEEIAIAIDKVRQGQSYLSPSLRQVH